MSDDRKIVGLIAGGGRLPVLVARGVRATGARVACVGLKNHYDDELPALCDTFSAAGVYRLGRWISLLRRAGVREAVLVGGVAKSRMHDPLRLLKDIPDWRALKVWYRRLRHDRRSPAVLSALADELSSAGITLIDSTTYIPDHLATEGPMTRRAPTEQQRADIDLGWPLLRGLLDLEIGQALALREGDVLAVEAVEGTDAMIERAGRLCRAKGWTMLKGSTARQDRRADVPTIGVVTIQKLAEAGAGCVALAAGGVILVDRPAVIEAADAAGIAIVGVSSEPRAPR